MVLGFDLVSWYGLAGGIAAFYLLWASVIDTGHRHYKAIKRLVRPEPRPAPESPVVVLGHPSYSYDTMTFPERRLQQRNYLTQLDPSYLIENKEATITVTDVTTGARRRDDGREHAFAEFKAPAIAPGEKAPVMGVSIPQDLFDGLTDEDHEGAFLFWARFSAPGGARWEVVYDPVKIEHSRALLGKSGA